MSDDKPADNLIQDEEAAQLKALCNAVVEPERMASLAAVEHVFEAGDVAFRLRPV